MNSINGAYENGFLGPVDELELDEDDKNDDAEVDRCRLHVEVGERVEEGGGRHAEGGSREGIGEDDSATGTGDGVAKEEKGREDKKEDVNRSCLLGYTLM